ncbi:MAG: GspH/FimT family protein [Candidatus Binatia bacterium]
MPISIRATTDQRDRALGFTLIETALVLLIIGLLLSLVIPRLPDVSSTRLDRSARRLATLLGYLHDEAALRGRVYRLTFDLDEESWVVDVHSPYAEGDAARDFTVLWDDYSGAGKLPEGLSFDSFTTAAGSNDAGRPQLYFLPEGNLEIASIRVVDESQRAITLRFDAMSGRVDLDFDGGERG